MAKRNYGLRVKEQPDPNSVYEALDRNDTVLMDAAQAMANTVRSALNNNAEKLGRVENRIRSSVNGHVRRNDALLKPIGINLINVVHGGIAQVQAGINGIAGRPEVQRFLASNPPNPAWDGIVPPPAAAGALGSDPPDPPSGPSGRYPDDPPPDPPPDPPSGNAQPPILPPTRLPPGGRLPGTPPIIAPPPLPAGSPPGGPAPILPPPGSRVPPPPPLPPPPAPNPNATAGLVCPAGQYAIFWNCALGQLAAIQNCTYAQAQALYSEGWRSGTTVVCLEAANDAAALLWMQQNADQFVQLCGQPLSGSVS